MTATWKDPIVPMILAQFYAGDRLTGVTGQVTPTATLWVNGLFGNDSATKAQVAAGGGAITWQTIGRAVWGSTNRNAPVSGEAAAAGDVVSIAAGTYTTTASVDDEHDPVYNPVNEGSATAYITFQANGIVIMGSPGGNAPIVGAFERDYIKWYADVTLGHQFQLTCDGRGAAVPDVKADPTAVNTRPDTGPVLFQATGTWIEGFLIDAGPQIDYDDNWDGVRLEGSIGGTLRNCEIRGFHNLSDGSNGAGVKCYSSDSNTFEHLYIHDCGSGVVFKDSPFVAVTSQDNIVRFCRIDDITGAIFEWSLTNEGGNEIYQNVCSNANIGIFVTAPGGNLNNEWLYNNTFVNCVNFVYISSSGVWSGARWWNNIHYNGTNRVVELDGQTMYAATAVSLQHNVYHFSAGNFYGGSDGSRDFTSYKAAYTDQDIDDPDSLNTDPLFTNAAGGDYTLQAGSPARNLGRHPLTNATMHAGAYQTGSEVIGVES